MKNHWITNCPHFLEGDKTAENRMDVDCETCFRKLQDAAVDGLVENYMDRFDHVMEEIRQERKRQTEKWGIQSHSDAHWLAIFLEEVGEIAKAIVEAKAAGSGDAAPMRKEIIHAVAVGVQWLERL